MKIITLAKTKELLGITGTDSDVKIARYIPIIDAKVKQITNNRYNYHIFGIVESGSKVVEVFGIKNATGGINNRFHLDDLKEFLDIGMLIDGTTIDDDTYIDDVYYNGDSVSISSVDKDIPTIMLSKAATSTDDNAELFLGINMGLQPTIAKGIQWLIDEENTDAPDLGWTSQRIGSVSVVRGVSQAEIDGRYGMPVWFVNAFPSYMSVH